MKQSVYMVRRSYRIRFERIQEQQTMLPFVSGIRSKWKNVIDVKIGVLHHKWAVLVKFCFCIQRTKLCSTFFCFLIQNRDSKYSDDTTSRDSDSLIQEYGAATPDLYAHCWQHPKVRENYRTVLAAVTLLIVGLVLVVMGVFALTHPQSGSQGVVFLLAGMTQSNRFAFFLYCCIHWYARKQQWIRFNTNSHMALLA